MVWLVLSVLAEAATAGCGQELMKIRVFPRDLLLLQRKIDRVDFTHIDPDVFLMFGYQVITDKKITGATKGRHSFIVIVNATGDIVGASRWNMRLWTPKLLNCSTVYMLSTTTDTHEDYRSNARFTLWNAESDRMIRVPIRGATHDLHYDPGSQTLFWLKNLMLHNPCQFPNSVCPDKKLVAAAFKSDNILRCKINGQVVWKWDTVDRLLRQNVSFRTPFSFGDRCDTDFAHMNTVIYYAGQNVLYWNSRTLHSFFKLDVATGALLWSVGRYATLRMYDEAGREVPELFQNAHGLHPVSDTAFYIFDNLHKGNCGDYSRLLRIEVDEGDGTARITWVWAPNAAGCARLYRNYGGGSFHLPTGHVIGTFGDRPQHYIVGVSAEGRVEFQMGIKQAFVYDSIMFYRTPRIAQVEVHDTAVSFVVYDALYTVQASDAVAEVESTCEPFRRQKAVTVLPFWQPNAVVLECPATGGFVIRFVNSAGVAGTHQVHRDCDSTSQAFAEKGAAWT
uniref:Uncharacterized protein n=1 Tax=Eutreptiella gymnastica TaxID=73025 RepID=A0A7S4G4W4_9EUGL